jgi:hypothetical protein
VISSWVEYAGSENKMISRFYVGRELESAENKKEEFKRRMTVRDVSP